MLGPLHKPLVLEDYPKKLETTTPYNHLVTRLKWNRMNLSIRYTRALKIVITASQSSTSPSPPPALPGDPSAVEETNRPTAILISNQAISPPTAMVQAPIHPSVTSRAKRGIDLAGGFLGLAVMAVITVPIAIAIQLDNPGPIFYRQTRCGYRGKPFTIWKFRSMVSNADAIKHLVTNEAEGLIFKNQNDPRITRVGRLLRRTSLDEFPQFLNVLKGEMSLVGTRPPTLDEVAHYDPHHWQRLQVKPGITGEWQVNGRSTVKDFEAVVALDQAYQQSWSIAYDLRLIWQTLAVVLQRKGAM